MSYVWGVVPPSALYSGGTLSETASSGVQSWWSLKCSSHPSCDGAKALPMPQVPNMLCVGLHAAPPHGTHGWGLCTSRRNAAKQGLSSSTKVCGFITALLKGEDSRLKTTEATGAGGPGMRLKWTAFLGHASKRTCKTLFTFLGCSNDVRPVLRFVSERGGTQGCDCTVFWCGRHVVIVISSSVGGGGLAVGGGGIIFIPAGGPAPIQGRCREQVGGRGENATRLQNKKCYPGAMAVVGLLVLFCFGKKKCTLGSKRANVYPAFSWKLGDTKICQQHATTKCGSKRTKNLWHFFFSTKDGLRSGMIRFTDGG